MPQKQKVELKTVCLKSQKNYLYMVFSLNNTTKDISMFLKCRFCQDWEFRAMKTQAQSGYAGQR
jgi:L-rhamnose mutarotase